MQKGASKRAAGRLRRGIRLVPDTYDQVAETLTTMERTLRNTRSVASPEQEHAALRAAIRTPLLDERARREPAAGSRADRQLRSRAARAPGPKARARTTRLSRPTGWPRQRALYELNRLRLYWFDDPACYVNEDSRVLAELRALLERPWQAWLARVVSPATLPGSEDPSSADPRELLRTWMVRDRTPADTEDSRWICRGDGPAWLPPPAGRSPRSTGSWRQASSRAHSVASPIPCKPPCSAS